MYLSFIPHFPFLCIPLSFSFSLSLFSFSLPPLDVMMSLHMQRLLKSHWQSRPLEKIKPIKKLSLKHKLSLGSRPSNPASSSSCSKDKHKLSNSLLSTVRKYSPLLPLFGLKTVAMVVHLLQLDRLAW